MQPTVIPSMLLSIGMARSSIRSTELAESSRFAGRWPAPVWSPKSPSSSRCNESSGQLPSCARLGRARAVAPLKQKAARRAAFCIPREGALVADARALRRLRNGCGCGGGCCFVQDAVVNGEQRQFQPVRHTNLVVDVAQVVLDHLLGRAQLGGDFLVLVPLND